MDFYTINGSGKKIGVVLQKIDVVLMSRVVERADVRMIQTRDGFCFALEALAQFSSVSKMSGKNLNGDNAVKPSVAGAINLAHPARTDSGEDFVGP